MEPIVLAAAIAAILLVVAGIAIASRRRGRAGKGTAAPSATPTTGTARPGRSTAAEPSRSGGRFRGEGLGVRIRSAFAKGEADAWQELETLLLKADVGPAASADLVARVRATHGDGDDAVELLRREILSVLGPDEPLRLPDDRLGVVLVVGVNGGGKTTSIGKLAALLVSDGKDVSLAAADTFRAAAGEQLEVWAARTGAHLVSQERGADPGAVAFDATTSAIARGSDVLIVDTAGRLHTKQPLMDELGKIRRVIEKAGGSIDETLLVLDAQTGQNGIAQARAFTDAAGVTGLVLTKTDGSAKGGIVLAVREELGVPVRFVGVGEGPGDLLPFDAQDFADRLLGS
jgi:fused signal recognition particle receptor